MWWRNVPRQLPAVVMGSLLLGGCGSLSEQFGNTGVGVPSAAQITNFYQATENETYIGGTKRRIKTGEYLVTSLTYTNEKCHIFFERLEAFKQDSKFLDEVLTAAVAAGSPFLALSGSKIALATVTSAVSATNILNTTSADIYAFAAFKEPLQTHVFDSMADYQSQKGLDLLVEWYSGVIPTTTIEVVEGRRIHNIARRDKNKTTIRIDQRRAEEFLASTETKDLLIARSMAADYASLCSLANMRKIMEESLHNTTSQSTANAGLSTAPATVKVVQKEQTTDVH